LLEDDGPGAKFRQLALRQHSLQDLVRLVLEQLGFLEEGGIDGAHEALRGPAL